MKSVLAKKVLNQRNEKIDNVDVIVTVTEIDKLTKENLAVVIEAGIKAFGTKWLTKYHNEETAKYEGEMSATDLVDWFVETEGTRGSTKQDLADAKVNVDGIEKQQAAVLRAAMSKKITFEVATAQGTVLEEKLVAAQVVMTEAIKAHDVHLAKVAERAEAKKAKEAAAK
jgi:hypothetical protein